ncbi:MAG: CPBP family intramembrane metalloprotease, partial [Cytophagia bacterium]|nr:CPBP family intramembrane metalloprotease [Cytophagia bacterium]
TLLRILGIVILAPIAEELMFRGFLLSRLLNKKINPHLAIAIQAILFVLLHSFAYRNDLSAKISIVQSFIDASLYGYARYHTKSILTPITMHMTGNSIALLEKFIG